MDKTIFYKNVIEPEIPSGIGASEHPRFQLDLTLAIKSTWVRNASDVACDETVVEAVVELVELPLELGVE